MAASNPFRGESRSLQVRLFVLYLLFVIYGSLVPLRYVDRDWVDALDAFSHIPFLELGIQSRSDWVANFLLFVPLTFLAGMVLNRTDGVFSRLLVALALMVLAVGLAFGIEFTQLFFPQRTVSQNDILAEGLGGILGSTLHLVAGARAQVWLDGFWREQQAQDRATILLRSYLLVLLLFNVLPLDLTLSPVEIFHKWKEGRLLFVPFSGLTDGWSTGLYSVITDLLIWVPVGALWAVGQVWHLRRIMWFGFLAAAGIEALQLFVFSRTTDVTDVLLGACGTLAGAVWLRRARPSLPRISAHIKRWMWAWWSVWATLLLCVFWFPFQFHFSGLSGADLVTAFTRVPFSTYYFGSEFHALNEVLRKVGFFLPAGWILGLGASLRTPELRRMPRLHLGALLMLAFLVELGQLALPGKVADLTDTFLEFAGAWLGYGMARWVNISTLDTQPKAKLRMATELTKAKALSEDRSGKTLPNCAGHIAFMTVLAVFLGVVLTSSVMPYNLRELIPSGLQGAGAAVVLSAVIYGMANGVFLLDRVKNRPFMWMLPVFTLTHAIVSWGLLRHGVPVEAMHDIVGSPTLGWAWEWELLGRYVALHASALLQVGGAVTLVQCVFRSEKLPRFLWWLVLSLALAWPLYTVVVTKAATDNLIELIANRGSFLSACLLAVGVLLTCLSGSALSAAFSTRRYIGLLLSLVLVGLSLASLCFWKGTEPVILKYGKLFSAMQFLLSTDRDHYVEGTSLALRFVGAMGGACVGLALLQWLAWRQFISDVRPKHLRALR